MKFNSRKLIRSLKILLVSLTAVVVVLGAVGVMYMQGIFGDPSALFGAGGDYEFTDEGGNEYKYSQGVISVAIIGLDSDSTREENNMGYRSDVMMHAVVDTNNNTASLVSFPRDTKAEVQVLESDGDPIRTVTTKLNAAFSYGFSPDKYGYPNTLDAMNRIYDESQVEIDPIEYYVGFDMEGFAGIADVLGGVELVLPHDVPGFGSEGETIVLEGDKALEYVRIRKGEGLDGSDLARTERQRGFVEACLREIQNSNPITTLPQLYNECISKGYLKTNLSIDQITAMAYSLTNIDLDTMTFMMLPGYLDGGYWAPDYGEIDKMLLELFYYSESGEEPELSTREKTTSKKTVNYTTTTEERTSAQTTTTQEKTTTKATTTTTTQKTTEAATTKETTKETTTAATTAQSTASTASQTPAP